MFLLMLLLNLFLGLGCAVPEPDGAQQLPAGAGESALVAIGDATYTVDLAVLPEERQQGLSGREFMAHDAGMLFVFDEEQTLHFWMKDMLFPLDIIWIDAQCRLIEVE